MSTPENSNLIRALEFAFEPDEAANARIGPYQLREKIGEGGFGVVWMAEQQEPVRRRVALKIIKTGMDTRELIVRFEAERQALALMEHPNIARVFDAGATEAGRPYFVMELVRGTPITQFCDENCVPTDARLRLYIDICHAVQHAHQKGIIHRDLKPSNILITLHDDKPVPKVIDFGIAKALGGAQLTDKTLFTRFHTFIGTPAYTSPEQIGMSGIDIDTRSDIYSLGVLLYVLLAGQPPFDAEQLNSAGLDEARRTILEVDPPRPSQRLRSLDAATRDTIARQRSTETAKLALVLRGDLDWVVMRCLEKERAHRYESAAALAADVERHLVHEPVIARPPSASYALQKLVRRHRGAFAAAGAIAAVLLIAAVVSTWLAIRATRAEHEQNRLRVSETLLREQAQRAQTAESNARVEAERHELTARRRAYASDMFVVQQALADSNLGRAQQLLDRQRPQPGQVDLRGWEWRYLWQLCQSEAKSVLAKGRNAFTAVAASPDGNWLAAEWDGSTGPNPIIWDLRTMTRAEIPVRGSVSHLAFSPREPFLAMVATRSHVILWDFTKRQTVREWVFSSTRDHCTGLFFSDDGQKLVTSTAGPQNEIRTWRVATGERLDSFPTGATAGTGFWTYFAATRDLRLAAYVTAGDGHVHVVDLVARRELWNARAAAEQITALSFSADGKILASGEGFHESPIRLWDAKSGIELGRMAGHPRFVSQLVFWPDGKTVASASGDQTVRLWDVASRTLKRTFRGHTLEVQCLALLPDKTLVSGSKNGELLLWDTTAEPAARAHTTIPGGVAVWRFSGDGNAIITIGPDGRVAERSGMMYQKEKTLLQLGTKIWSVDEITREILDHGWIPARARASTMGSTILAADSPRLAHVSADRHIEVWDWERGERVGVIAANQNGERLAPLSFAAKGETLFLSRLVQQPRRVMREEWELASGRQRRAWTLDAGSLSGEVVVALSPDQKRFISVEAPTSLLRTDLDVGSKTRLELDVRGTRWPGSFSGDSSLIALPNLNGRVDVVNVDPLRSVATLSGFLTAIHSATFSPDGARLATGSGGTEAITIWDVSSYERVLTIPVNGSRFRQAAFSPDGNVLGALSGNRESPTLHLWRAPTKAEVEAVEKQETTLK